MVLMKVEIDGTTYHTTQKYYSPDWWDKWSKKNLRKKRWLFSRTGNGPVFVPRTVVSLQYMILVTLGLI
jgi:hypothetical protein